MLQPRRDIGHSDEGFTNGKGEGGSGRCPIFSCSAWGRPPRVLSTGCSPSCGMSFPPPGSQDLPMACTSSPFIFSEAPSDLSFWGFYFFIARGPGRCKTRLTTEVCLHSKAQSPGDQPEPIHTAGRNLCLSRTSPPPPALPLRCRYQTSEQARLGQ